jgi:hypothetical protein
MTSREIQALRKRYAEHRDALARLAADAPTERLAQGYARLRAEIDGAIAKIDEIERGGSPSPASPTPYIPAPMEPITRPHPAAPELQVDQELLRPETGTMYEEPPQRRPIPPAVIVVALLALLALLGFFAWRYTGGQDGPTIVEEAGSEPAAAPTTTAEPAPVIARAEVLSAVPAAFDYGVVRKGTRKSQRFSLTNNSAAPLNISVSRSQCRCLWFDHPKTIPANGKATLTVTIDGGRVAAGAVSEVVEITSAGNVDVNTAIDLRATVE